jgi:glycerol-3-phosphate dehydrogenase
LHFAAEGAVLVGGAALQWLRDGLGVIESATESERLATEVDSTDGVFFVPVPSIAGRRVRRDLAREAIAYLGASHLAGDEPTVDARRETAFLSGKGGMLTVAGGKLTTYRRIALDALGHLSAELGLAHIDRRPVPLPGATDATNVAARLVTGWGLEPSVAAHLAHFYGSRADRVLGLAAERPELLERIHPDAPDIAAQVVFATHEEWATSAEDILHRRTTLAARGLGGPDVVRHVNELLST